MRILAVAARSFVLHATPTTQQLGDFNITRDPTLGGLRKVFGPFDDCTKRAWFSMGVWRTLGFRARLTSSLLRPVLVTAES